MTDMEELGKEFEPKSFEDRMRALEHFVQRGKNLTAIHNCNIAKEYLCGNLEIALRIEVNTGVISKEAREYYAFVKRLNSPHCESAVNNGGILKQFDSSGAGARGDEIMTVVVSEPADGPQQIIPSAIRLQSFYDWSRHVGELVYLSLCYRGIKICRCAGERKVNLFRSGIYGSCYMPGHMIHCGTHVIEGVADHEADIIGGEFNLESDLYKAISTINIWLNRNLVNITTEKFVNNTFKIKDVLSGPFQL